MIGMDSVLGTPRLTFGVRSLNAGISTVPALVGLFGFAEVLSVVSAGQLDAEANSITRQTVKIRDMLRELRHSLYYSLIGVVVGALPGAGGPVAAFLAYSQAKRIVKQPSRPFGEGAVEGIVASESANNACIGGALIPMLTLAVPGDAVTAIILSVFYVHGLRPGPMFLTTGAESFYAILGGGFIGCVFLLGAYACNNRLFDVGLMLFFGVLGFLMRARGYPVAPMTLAIVLGGMMDANLRRAISLASSADSRLSALFGRPITMVLLALTLFSVVGGIPPVRRALNRRKETKAANE